MAELEDDVLRAKEDPDYRNSFLKKNKKFILTTAYRTLNRYVTDSDDEWSVALLAFNEAIDEYEESRGSFESFAKLVIKRRLLNHSRSESKYRNEYSTEPTVLAGELSGEEDPSSFQMEVRSRISDLSTDDRRQKLVEEIGALKKEINSYGIDFFGLEAVSPKAEKTRKMCLALVAELKTDDALMKRLRETKSLPITELCARTRIQKKVLERHRKYIITAAEIVCGDYPLLKEYIPL